MYSGKPLYIVVSHNYYLNKEIADTLNFSNMKICYK